MFSQELLIALKELSQQLWPDESPKEFRRHWLYDVYVRHEGKKNLKLVFGNSMLEKSKRSWRYLRKLSWIKRKNTSVLLPLPGDSIIFIRENKNGSLIISKSKSLAVKIFLTKEATSLLEDEISTLKFLKTTPFANSTLKFISDGSTSSGGRWLITEFFSNPQPLSHENHPDQYLLNHFAQIIMPQMKLFYKSYPIQIADIKTWTEHAQNRAKKLGMDSELRSLIKRVFDEGQKHPEYQMVECQIHHDLHAGNLLRDKDKIIIMDWEGAGRGALLIDIFDFLRRVVVRKSEFWRYLKTNNAPAPTEVVNIFEFYRRWLRDEFGANIPEGSEKLTLFVYALERTLLLKEKRNLDRLKDHSGFEYKALKASLL